MKLLRLQDYGVEKFVAPYLDSRARVLNAGCGNRRFGPNVLNVDITARPAVDLVHDLNEPLPEALGTFDAILCSAVLQYCRAPHKVLVNLREALVPGGRLYVSAPWVQQVCTDTPDRFRFSGDGLRGVVEDAGFVVEMVAPSIRPGAALAWLAWELADHATPSRVMNVGLRVLVGAAVWPLRFIRTIAPHRSAGAFYCVARKP